MRHARLHAAVVLMLIVTAALAQDAPRERWQFKTLTACLVVQHY